MTLDEIFRGAITPSKWRALGAHLARQKITGGVGVRVSQDRFGTIVSAGRKTGGGGISASDCPFGEIIAVDSGGFTQGIRGGVIYCGDKNFNVPFRGINLASAGTWLIEISLSGIDPATDDDDEIFLSGVVTASGTPTWAAATYTGSENYTNNTNPATPPGTGAVIIPIGILTVADGAATLAPVGCGNVTVGQCAGILSLARG